MGVFRTASVDVPVRYAEGVRDLGNEGAFFHAGNSDGFVLAVAVGVLVLSALARRRTAGRALAVVAGSSVGAAAAVVSGMAVALVVSAVLTLGHGGLGLMWLAAAVAGLWAFSVTATWLLPRMRASATTVGLLCATSLLSFGVLFALRSSHLAQAYDHLERWPGVVQRTPP